jgi:glycosyltransferase involved in cell wall biosynthesis
LYTVGLDISAIDGTFREHTIRGIGRYVRELHAYFESHQGNDVAIAFFDHQDVRPARALDALIEKLPTGGATLRSQVVHPLCLAGRNTRKFDVLHFPAHMDAPSWNMKKYLLTVLDLIPLVYSDLYKADRAGWKFHLARWFERRAIKNATHILTISEHTARDVNRILGVPYERMSITPLGVNEHYFSAELTEDEVALRNRYGIPAAKKIILYVGGIDQRKNYPTLLKTMGKVVSRYRERKQDLPVLVMVGQIEQDRQFPKLIALIAEHGLKEHVVLSGFVPEDDLVQLYAITSVFCFLSLYEGFGLPPLEALAAGVPVVSSNASAMPEVLGHAAIMVNPLDAEGAAHHVCQVLENPNLVEKKREEGRKQARKFPWSRTGDATLAVYERFASGNIH